MVRNAVARAAVTVAAAIGLAGGAAAQDDPMTLGVISPQSPPGSIAQGSEGRVGLALAERSLEACMDEVFARFPDLEAWRGRRAVHLSGGQCTMLEGELTHQVRKWLRL